MTAVTVTVDASICCGSGMCASILPEVFRVTPEGIAGILASDTELAQSDAIRAAKSCPTLCIAVFSDGAEVELF